MKVSAGIAQCKSGEVRRLTKALQPRRSQVSNPAPRSTSDGETLCYRVTRAYCYASGLIEFAPTIPRGTITIARGPEQQLRAFIAAQARHGYLTEEVEGRPTKIADSEQLLVPGVPEAPNARAALAALEAWVDRLATIKPRNVTVF